MEFTANELQLLTVLWNAFEPLTCSEIFMRSLNKTWKDTSLHTILNRLLQKDAIKEVGSIYGCNCSIKKAHYIPAEV